MLHHDNYMVAMDFFAASNSYDFFNQYCSNLLKNPTVRGLPLLFHSIVGLARSRRKERLVMAQD